MGTFRRRFGWLVVLSSAGYLISFTSQLLISYYFGTSSKLDGYWSALAVINLLCFFVTPLFEALIPELHAAAKSNTSKSTNNLFSAALLLVLSLTAIMAICLVIIPGPLIGLATGNAGIKTAENINIALLWLFPSLLFFPLSTILNAILTSYNLVVYQAVTRLLGAISTLTCLAIIGGALGVGTLAIGLMAGQLITIFFSFIALYRRGIRLYWVNMSHLKTGHFYPMFCSLLLVYLFAGVYTVFERRIMISLSDGLISSFQYGVALVNVLISLLAYPLANLLWPRFLDERFNIPERQALDSSINVIGYVYSVLVAACALIFINSNDIILLIYKHGEFGLVSTLSTSQALKSTIFTAIPIGLSSILSRFFVSTGKQRVVSLSSVVTLFFGLIVLIAAFFLKNIFIAQLNWLIANIAGFMTYFIAAVLIKKPNKNEVLILLYHILIPILIVYFAINISPNTDPGLDKISAFGNIIKKSIYFFILYIPMLYLSFNCINKFPIFEKNNAVK